MPVHLSQNIGWGRIPRRLSPQNAPADRHDKRCGNAFSGNIGDRDSESFVINMNVIEIITAHLAGRHVDAANLKSVDSRRFSRKQNTLNVTRDLEIMVEPLLFVGHRIDDGVIESKSRLFGDGFKHDEIALREWRALGAISEREHT